MIVYSLAGLVALFLGAIAFVCGGQLKSPQEPLHMWKTLRKFQRLRPILFSWAIRKLVPYCSTIHFRVVTYDKGFCSGVLTEEARVHNPFDSIHLGALITFGETIGGLAVLSQLGSKDRAIPVKITSEFKKKARGLIMATSNFYPGEIAGRVEKESEVVLQDEVLDTVAKLTIVWSIDSKST